MGSRRIWREFTQPYCAVIVVEALPAIQPIAAVKWAVRRRFLTQPRKDVRISHLHSS
jgi:hypothetical protein